MSWSKDCSGPVAHEDIVAIFKTVGAWAITDALLAFLKLFKKSEVSRYCGNERYMKLMIAKAVKWGWNKNLLPLELLVYIRGRNWYKYKKSKGRGSRAWSARRVSVCMLRSAKPDPCSPPLPLASTVTTTHGLFSLPFIRLCPQITCCRPTLKWKAFLSPCSEEASLIHMTRLSVRTLFGRDDASWGWGTETILNSASTVKTTDENLTSENWELILNLCDRVQDEGEQGYVSSLFPSNQPFRPSRLILTHFTYSAALVMSLMQCSKGLHIAIPMFSSTH